MNTRTLTIILAVALVGCFFLPYVSVGGFSASGYDSVFKMPGNWQKYIPALIPLSGILLLIGAANNGNYPLGRNLLAWLPLLTVIYMLVIDPLLIHKQSIGDMIKVVGYGLWISVAAAVVL